MIISQVTVGSLTDLAVDEVAYATATGLSADNVSTYKYTSPNWYDTATSTVVNMATLGITFDGTPTTGDTIVVAYHPSEMYVFSAGKGINCVKINDNFDQLKTDINDNELAIDDIANNALLKDGSNLTQSIIDDFQSQTPNVLSTSGTIALTDNTANFLTLTGNATISLPSISPDQYSHTITMVVAGGSYTLNLGTVYHLYNDLLIDTTKTYNVLYIYNKIDGNWYYSLTQ